jgi:hypothetical protein
MHLIASLLVSLSFVASPYNSIHGRSLYPSTNFKPFAAESTQPATPSRKEVFEDSLITIYNSIRLDRYNLSYEAFRYGMIGYLNLKNEGRLSQNGILSIIDFTKASTEKRFYTIDLAKRKVKFYTYVSHGKNTGENKAERFSNVIHSNQSSLGFYITGETYVGSKGFSLKLDGVDKGYNDRMRERAVVIHAADYVSERWIKNVGRLGRSQGCPALPINISRQVINQIKNKTLIFAYFNDENYLKDSNYLNIDTILNDGHRLIPQLQLDNASELSILKAQEYKFEI